MRKLSKNIFKPLLFAAIIAEVVLIGYYAIPLIFRTPVAFIQIQSESMLPVLKEGDWVVVDGRSKEDFKALEGKIIAFYDPTQGRIIVHRAIGIDAETLITKGDNNDLPDLFKPGMDYVLGKVSK